MRRPELPKEQWKTVLPCVNLGQGPLGTRVGRPRLDSIRGHKEMSLRMLSVEADDGREKKNHTGSFHDPYVPCPQFEHSISRLPADSRKRKL